MNEARLNLFPGAWDQRIGAPQWRGTAAPVTLDRLLAQLRAIDAEHCQRLVLAGETPLDHPDLVGLVKECRRLGFRHIALETTASALARRGLVTVLGRIGITQLVVAMAGVREAVHDEILREPGSLASALEGLRHAVAASAKGGPSVYLVAPMWRCNADDLEALLDWAINLPGKLQGFLLALPEISNLQPSVRSQILPYATQAAIAARLFRHAQGHNVEYGFTTRRGLVPCAAEPLHEHFGTVFHERAQFFQHTARVRDQESFVRVAACDDCSLVQSCPGIEAEYVEQFGSSEFASVPLSVSMDWKLRRINRLEQFDYRNVSPFVNDSVVNPRGLIRINGHCNMSCAFCFVDRTVADFELDGLKDEVAKMALSGTRHLVLSGGEPTLHPQLAELIAYANGLDSFDVIEIQTNGVKCAELAYCQSLVEAGLNKVTVSLHSVDAEHSDSITRLPQAFGKTLQSMHNFRRLGVVTQIAHVITKANYQELPETMRFLRREFPAEGGHLSICLAIAQGISDLVFQWVIPSFTEIKPFVREALDYCLDSDIGFGGMIGQGGYPPCMLDGDLRYYRDVLDKVFRSGDAAEQFFKPEQCRECSFDAHCLGPRRSYVEHYGDAEIRPFRGEIPEFGGNSSRPRNQETNIAVRSEESGRERGTSTGSPSAPK